MKAARIFDPRFVGRLGYDLGEDAVDALDEFKFYTHPELHPKIQQMKAELPTYLQRVKEIPPYNERVVDGKDSFNLKRWWLGNCGDLPAWVIVMRAVLTNFPNSCPPERVFSILEDSFDDDQRRAYEDYLQLSLMTQFNNRGRRSTVIHFAEFSSQHRGLPAVRILLGALFPAPTSFLSFI